MPGIDHYTGKPWPEEWSLLGSPNGQRCEDCGGECIDRCLRCGAPQCCPACCLRGEGEEGLRHYLPCPECGLTHGNHKGNCSRRPGNEHLTAAKEAP